MQCNAPVYLSSLVQQCSPPFDVHCLAVRQFSLCLFTLDAFPLRHQQLCVSQNDLYSIQFCNAVLAVQGKSEQQMSLR